MIELHNISKIYSLKNKDEFHALKNISLTVRRGEFVTVLGKSGSGKSTLLNIIGGLDSISSGDLIIDGISTKNFTNRDWDTYRNEQIGFIFQSFNLISHLTAIENVELIMKIDRVNKEQRRKRAIELLKLVGLEDQMDKKPDFMSGGQQQRVAIARALANDPEIILADEPTGSLDSNTSKEILELIKKIGKNRIVIFITHDHELVRDYETRLIKINDGIIQEDTEIRPIKFLSEMSIEVKKKSSFIFMDILKIALNNVNRKKRKMLLMSFGLIIGSFTMLLGLALGQGGYDVSYEQIRENANVSSYTITKDSSEFTETDISNIENIPNVSMVQKDYIDTFQTYVVLDEFRILTFDIEASVLPNNKDKFIFKDNIILGTYPNDEDEMIINVKSALDLYVKITNNKYHYIRYEKGELTLDYIWLALNNYNMNVYILGPDAGPSSRDKIVISKLSIVGVFDADLNEYRDNSGFFISESLAKTIYLAQNNDNRNPAEVKPSSLTVIMNDYDLESRNELKSNIKALNTQFLIDDSVDLQIKKTFALIDLAFAVIFLLVGIGFISAAAMITVVIYSSVMERKKEIGILKAIGSSKQNILFIFLIEGIVIGIIGTSLGLILGALAIYYINPAFNEYLFKISNLSSNKNIFIADFKTYIFTLISGVFVAFCGGILPARNAANIYPVNALREE